MKIMIVGAGGVGGYLAAKLTASAEVTLVARGAHLVAMQKNGLTVVGDGDAYTAHPALLTDKPEEAGVQDAILFCTKSYGLKDAVLQALPCIGEHTALLPLLNGVSAGRVIRENTDRGILLLGNIYIFSQIEAPGVIKKVGDMCRVAFGSESGEMYENMQRLADAMNAGGVNAEISKDIRVAMWMKWLMMLSNAQAAAYYNVCIGAMREDVEMMRFVEGLLDEAIAVGKAEGVKLPLDARDQVLKTIQGFAYESTPSVARDLNTPGKATELSVFGGELVRLAKKHGIAAPCNQEVLNRFSDRV